MRRCVASSPLGTEYHVFRRNGAWFGAVGRVASQQVLQLHAHDAYSAAVCLLTLSVLCRLLLGLLVDELARMPDDVERSYDLSLFLVLHADDPGIAVASNAVELYAACTALAPSIGPSVQSCLETIQAYTCAHDVFQHLLELKGLVATPDSNGCTKPFSPCGIIIRRLCLAAQAASFEQLATLFAELEVRVPSSFYALFCSFMTLDRFAAILSAGPCRRHRSHSI